MKVVIATVGGSEIPIIAAARKLGLDKAVLISGKPASQIFDEPVKNDVDPIEISENIRKKLESLGVEVKIVTVNPFSFEECCIKAMETIEKEKGNEISVVVSGGTKIQTLAASYAAFISGCRMYYVQETSNGSELVEIPLTFTELDGLSRAKKEVLRAIEDGDDAARIAEKLKISRKTASQYLKELREYGLIESTDGKVKRYRLTLAGKICRARWLVNG